MAVLLLSATLFSGCAKQEPDASAWEMERDQVVASIVGVRATQERAETMRQLGNAVPVALAQVIGSSVASKLVEIQEKKNLNKLSKKKKG